MKFKRLFKTVFIFLLVFIYLNLKNCSNAYKMKKIIFMILVIILMSCKKETYFDLTNTEIEKPFVEMDTINTELVTNKIYLKCDQKN